jgi:hypothetical protein
MLTSEQEVSGPTPGDGLLQCKDELSGGVSCLGGSSELIRLFESTARRCGRALGLQRDLP